MSLHDLLLIVGLDDPAELLVQVEELRAGQQRTAALPASESAVVPRLDAVYQDVALLPLVLTDELG